MKNKYIQNCSENELKKYTKDVEECRALLEQLKQALSNYSDSQIKNNKVLYKDQIQKCLIDLKENQGYEILLILFNYQFINNLGEEVIPEVIELIKVVNPYNRAKLPWEFIPLFLYQKDIEKRFAKDPLNIPNPERITDIDDYKNILLVEPVFNEIMNSFMYQQKNARTREIYEIFANYCILKELGRDFEYRTLKDNGRVEKAKKEEIKSIKDEFISYFNDYYKKIESKLDKNLYKRPDSNYDWNSLLSEARNLHGDLVDFKDKHYESLINYDKDEKARLTFDIKQFLIKAEGLDWKVFPKVSDINHLEGGSGLIKRIVREGGMKEIGNLYNQMIKNDLAVENFLKVDLIRNVKGSAPPTEIKGDILEKDEIDEIPF